MLLGVVLPSCDGDHEELACLFGTEKPSCVNDCYRAMIAQCPTYGYSQIGE